MAALTISDVLDGRLSELGGAMFTKEEVIDRLITHWRECSGSDNTEHFKPEYLKETETQARVDGYGRQPRQRGVSVNISGTRFVASTVRDLYEQVLRFLVDDGVIKSHPNLIPFRTSAARYLVSRNPKHPNGKDFFVPVNYGGLFMESHKSYDTAITQLGMFLAKLGLEFRHEGG